MSFVAMCLGHPGIKLHNTYSIVNVGLAGEDEKMGEVHLTVGDVYPDGRNVFLNHLPIHCNALKSLSTMIAFHCTELRWSLNSMRCVIINCSISQSDSTVWKFTIPLDSYSVNNIRPSQQPPSDKSWWEVGRKWRSRRRGRKWRRRRKEMKMKEEEERSDQINTDCRSDGRSPPLSSTSFMEQRNIWTNMKDIFVIPPHLLPFVLF